MRGNQCSVFCLIILLLNGDELVHFSLEKMPAFPLARIWWRQQINPRVNPVNTQQEIVDQKLDPLLAASRVKKSKFII